MNRLKDKIRSIRPILQKVLKSSPACIAINLIWVYVAYLICRIVFILLNPSTTTGISGGELWQIFRGGFLFDTSAIFYTNALYILLILFPLHLKERPKFQLVAKWFYIVINTLAIVINLADSVFFEFRRQRTTSTILKEFGGEDNLTSIIGHEALSHWYLFVLCALMVWAMWRLYRVPQPSVEPRRKYYRNTSIWLIIFVFITLCGISGNAFYLKTTRPISSYFAFRYTRMADRVGAILNTPFTLIRTINLKAMSTPKYFATDEELDAIYSPLHVPSDSVVANKKNIVIIILESFSKEFVGGFNHDLDGGTYKGYTPFIDSMLDSVMWHDEMIANTFYSIDAPPAVTASIPRAVYPFVLSSHAVNRINSLATELKKFGYATAFFHGADNQSLGIQSFTRQAGFERYYGKNEFCADPRFGGQKEYDGAWGIWDEPFLQFSCDYLSKLPQPFLAGIFTLSSHHPFKVPKKYADRFKEEGKFEINKCVRYSDFALSQFFESARRQPWFNNTIFILTADHTSPRVAHREYINDIGGMRIPILYYDPSGNLPRGRQPGISQQIDIMPTVLGLVGYDRPYIAFGKDLLSTPADQHWAVNWVNLPTYIEGDYMMIFDGEEVIGLYNIRTDRFQEHNLAGKMKDVEDSMKLRLKAIMQSYLGRMNSNDLTIDSATK